ncbi:hypothetical protein CesoFtcFv8_019291 [Champsocephalus esox]|uniref:Uncharacterized protein n=1 Tax=Champsocephalus esox TaxID=159716 RepID=A0AAN8BIG3_9TELE|nr:hypothetical protein CesoFtcFv8_019291 [Champsocephalus esox]
MQPPLPPGAPPPFARRRALWSRVMDPLRGGAATSPDPHSPGLRGTGRTENRALIPAETPCEHRGSMEVQAPENTDPST